MDHYKLFAEHRAWALHYLKNSTNSMSTNNGVQRLFAMQAQVHATLATAHASLVPDQLARGNFESSIPRTEPETDEG